MCITPFGMCPTGVNQPFGASFDTREVKLRIFLPLDLLRRKCSSKTKAKRKVYNIKRLSVKTVPAGNENSCRFVANLRVCVSAQHKHCDVTRGSDKQFKTPFLRLFSLAKHICSVEMRLKLVMRVCMCERPFFTYCTVPAKYRHEGPGAEGPLSE